LGESAAEPLKTARLEFPDNDRVRALCGAHSENLKLMEKRLGVQLGTRGGQIVIAGAEEGRVRLAEGLLRELYGLLEEGYPLYLEDVDQATKLAGQGVPLREIFGDTVFVSSRHRVITPKGLAQKRYVQAIRERDIVFGIGPAGTGKTYLAMAMAVAFLVDRRVKRIVLTRPAVEAGERLGFLPGDIAEKVNPYLRPLHDALFDMVDYEKATALIERGTVEVAPLAFMRGRTLNDAFVILDEAQNTTEEQMKMFLTRLGYGSKAVVTGDVTQVDLPSGRGSGLVEVQKILHAVEGVSFCHFSEVDVVRHPLVQEVVRAYDAYEAERRERAEREKAARPGRPAGPE
jgi:phosphate starvation-inducible PhoH-like protein